LKSPDIVPVVGCLRDAHGKTPGERPPLARHAAKQQGPCQTSQDWFCWGILVPRRALAAIVGSRSNQS
jgi:hypothetical protein